MDKLNRRLILACYFMFINFLFLILVFPLFLYSMLDTSILGLLSPLFYVIYSIFLGPAIITSHHFMYKITLEKNIFTLTDYIGFYKSVFKSGAITSLCFSIFIYIIYINMLFFKSIGFKVLYILSLVLIIIASLVLLNYYLVESRLKNSLHVNIKNAVFLTFRYISLDVVQIMTLIIMLILVNIFNVASLSFKFSFYFFINTNVMNRILDRYI